MTPRRKMTGLKEKPPLSVSQEACLPNLKTYKGKVKFMLKITHKTGLRFEVLKVRSGVGRIFGPPYRFLKPCHPIGVARLWQAYR